MRVVVCDDALSLGRYAAAETAAALAAAQGLGGRARLAAGHNKWARAGSPGWKTCPSGP
jgi:hypothetical protein